MGNSMTNTGSVSLEKKAASKRRHVRHKPNNKPKRPLSAYNYFFQAERKKIVKAANCDDKAYRKWIDPELDEKLVEKLKRNGNMINFEEIGKIIGSRWRKISIENATHYKSLADLDKKRYADELEACKQRKERTRYEINAFDGMNTMHSQEQYAAPQCMSFARNGGHTGYMQNDTNSNGYRQIPTTHYTYYSPPLPVYQGPFRQDFSSNINCSSRKGDSSSIHFSNEYSFQRFSQPHNHSYYPQNVQNIDQHSYGPPEAAYSGFYQARSSCNAHMFS